MRMATESERATIADHIDPVWAIRVEAEETFPVDLLRHLFWSSEDQRSILEVRRDGSALLLHTLDETEFDLSKDIDDEYITYSAELRTIYVKSAGWIHEGHD